MSQNPQNWHGSRLDTVVVKSYWAFVKAELLDHLDYWISINASQTKRIGNYSNSHFLAISSYVYCICDIMFGMPWVACWGEFSTEMYGNRGCI